MVRAAGGGCDEFEGSRRRLKLDLGGKQNTEVAHGSLDVEGLVLGRVDPFQFEHRSST